MGPGDDNENRSCRSMLGCFYFLFYKGLNTRGSLEAFLQTAEPGTETYPMRIIFDSAFSVIVGLVLVNIITGLMVEFFSSARLNKSLRSKQMDNECFVCGLKREEYEDLAHKSLRSFDAHCDEEHFLWAYVYFVAYLQDKDPTEDSGIESYVRSKVAAGSVDWIPSRTSFALEALGTTAQARR